MDRLRARQRVTFLFALALVVAIAPATANASTYRWQVDANGDWNNPSNWTVVEGPAGAGYPNLAGDVAVIENAITAARTITIPNGVTITIGRLEIDEAEQVIIAGAGTGLLAFDNLGEDAEISSQGVGAHLLGPIDLRADLAVVRNGEMGIGSMELRAITESGGSRNVTKTGTGTMRFEGGNTYTGVTTIVEGDLRVRSGDVPSIPGDLIIGDGTGPRAQALVSITGQGVAPTSTVTVNADGRLEVSRFTNSSFRVFIGDLIVHGGRVGLVGLNIELNITNLTMEGGVLHSPNFSRFALSGNLTATSVAGEPATIETASVLMRLTDSTPHTITVNDGPQSTDLQVTQGITGTDVQVIKAGTGVAYLGPSSYTGQTRVTAGTLYVESTTALNSAEVVSGVLGIRRTIGALTATGGRIDPSTPGPPAILTTGPVTLAAASTLQLDIVSGTSYDGLAATGSVDLGGAQLVLTSVPLLPPTAVLTIVDNDGADPVVGTFDGLPEGATISAPGGTLLTISYVGGDGNDVVLTNIAPVTYYLSEGATGTFFDEDVLIANPNTVAAPITMTFFLPGGAGTVVQQHTVPPQSRLTVRVDEIEGLESTSPSVEVKSDNRLVLGVERTMFWDQTHYGGHTANAVPAPRNEWMFAEGVQNDFFQTFLLLNNPNASDTTASVTFLREGEPPVVKEIDLPAQSRVTVSAGDYPELVGRSFGMTVLGTLPIAAERAMYFASTPQRLWSGGHANEGIASASTTWFHPEGATGTFFSTFILISNPQDSPANVTYRFLAVDRPPTIEATRTIPPKQRLTLNAADVYNLGATSFSTVVTSDVPVVSERAMYWPGDDTPFGEGHASSGLPATAIDWVLAEGRIGGPAEYKTYVLLANPGVTDADVRVTILPETGTPITWTFMLKRESRFNIDVNGMPELQNQSFGVRVEVTNNVPIAVERSMYWNSGGRFWSGGSNALGTIIPH